MPWRASIRPETSEKPGRSDVHFRRPTLRTGKPWISTPWLAQVLLARTYAVFGWSGPVVLAAGAIAATLMRAQSAATKLLDHIDGWQKVYADDIATIHVRKADAVRTAEPAVDPKTK
jgi:hypothetical protein